MIYKTSRVYHAVTENIKRYNMLRGGTRCFTGLTKVLTISGYKNIKDIQKGDFVLTKDGKYYPVINKFSYVCTDKQRELIKFSNGIKCTPNHKFLFDGQWIEAKNLRKRALDKILRPLLSEQSRKDNSIELERLKGCTSYEASVIEEAIKQELQGSIKDRVSREWEKHTSGSASLSSSGIFTQSREQTTSTPQEPRPTRQQSRKPYVGNSQRKYGTLRKSWKANIQQWFKKWYGKINRRSGKNDQGNVCAVQSNKKGFSEDFQCFGGVRKRRTVSTLEALTIKYIYSDDTVYDLEVETVHNYTVTRENIIAHNSTKSFSLTQMVVRWLMYGKIGKYYIPKGDFFILRESFPALRRTVLKDFETILSREGFMDYVDHKKSTNQFERNGRIVSFFSADDDSKIHGPQSDFFWINEATAVDLTTFHNLDWRCNNFCFLDYNPMEPESWVRSMEDGEIIDKDDISLDISTVHDNEFLSKPQMKAILSIKDNELRNVYLKGQWTKLSGLVFPNFEIVDCLPDFCEKRYFAIDFGWVHPFVLLEFRQVDNNVYIHEHIHQSEFDYQELEELRPKLMGIKGCADSADPRSIKAIRNMGFRITAVKKPKIIESVRRVREHNLFITKQSENTIKDFKTYKRQKDKNDEYIEEPLKHNDDAPDAVRYGISTFSRKSLIKLY